MDLVSDFIAETAMFDWVMLVDSIHNRPYIKTSNCLIGLLLGFTQQDYYDLQQGRLLHSYCTSTYTEVTALLL